MSCLNCGVLYDVKKGVEVWWLCILDEEVCNSFCINWNCDIWLTRNTLNASRVCVSRYITMYKTSFILFANYQNLMACLCSTLIKMAVSSLIFHEMAVERIKKISAPCKDVEAPEKFIVLGHRPWDGSSEQAGVSAKTTLRRFSDKMQRANLGERPSVNDDHELSITLMNEVCPFMSFYRFLF